MRKVIVFAMMAMVGFSSLSAQSTVSVQKKVGISPKEFKIQVENPVKCGDLGTVTVFTGDDIGFFQIANESACYINHSNQILPGEFKVQFWYKGNNSDKPDVDTSMYVIASVCIDFSHDEQWVLSPGEVLVLDVRVSGGSIPSDKVAWKIELLGNPDLSPRTTLMDSNAQRFTVNNVTEMITSTGEARFIFAFNKSNSCLFKVTNLLTGMTAYKSLIVLVK